MNKFEPCYLQAFESGKLHDAATLALGKLNDCNLCPQLCGTNRMTHSDGVCRTGKLARIAAFHPHFGEESPLVGLHGSGTIFFSYCNLNCQFCQNYDISREGTGSEVTPERIANMMLDLQDQGCHNINLVTPSHVVPQILAALIPAINAGLRIPLVFNSSAYDLVDTLKMLDGIIDIYMPDFKFWDSQYFEKFSGAANYKEIATAAITEMQRQVGDLQLGEDRIARRGLLLRHMVMPGRIADTRQIIKFVADHISKQTYLNLMAQYHPVNTTIKSGDLNRPVSKEEFRQALRFARESGIERIDWESKRVVFDWQE